MNLSDPHGSIRSRGNGTAVPLFCWFCRDCLDAPSAPGEFGASASPVSPVCPMRSRSVDPASPVGPVRAVRPASPVCSATPRAFLAVHCPCRLPPRESLRRARHSRYVIGSVVFVRPTATCAMAPGTTWLHEQAVHRSRNGQVTTAAPHFSIGLMSGTGTMNIRGTTIWN